MYKLTLNSVLIAAAALLCLPSPSAQAAETEDSLIAVLTSGASEKEKADACLMLARIGTAKAVPALVALLGDEKLSHMARYALEPIPDPAVDVALRGALAKLEGRKLVGVIGSLGVRRDLAATGALVGLLRAGDAQVACAAARALGSFGSRAAVDALQGALSRAETRLCVIEGLLRCAESQAAGGDRAIATAIYDRLRALKDAPHQVRTAALRGAVLVRGNAGLPLLLEALRGRDPLLVRAATRTSLELPGADVTKALAGALGDLDQDGQILLADALGKRGDKEAMPALLALAKKGDAMAREAGIRAACALADASAVPVLVGLLDDPIEGVASAARAGLATLEGPEVETAIAAMLSDADPKTRGAAIDLLGQRRSSGSVPALLKAAQSDDPLVRAASIQALGSTAGAKDFPAIVKLLVGAGSASDRDALEKLLMTLCADNSRPVAGEVVIRKAVYGDLPDGKSADVTAKVAEMVKRGTLSIDASNGNFGDPASGITKKLRVEYAIRGAARTDTVGEGQTLRIKGGKAPQAFIDALKSAAAGAPPEAKAALERILRATSAGAK
ncbi:MAG: HEAT repeat domain-containing protein [Planctomycetes bacterium]|nr:HEAT repeat domain-containing protein [Planctomycetota bacterium]